jgi:hypothetical protein
VTVSEIVASLSQATIVDVFHYCDTEAHVRLVEFILLDGRCVSISASQLSLGTLLISLARTDGKGGWIPL